MSEYTKELSQLSMNELVAYWNILQWQLKGGLKVDEKIDIVANELRKRGQSYEKGKRLVPQEES